MCHVYTLLLRVHLHERDVLLIYYHLCFFMGGQDNHQPTHIPEAIISLLAKVYSQFIEVYLGQHTD